MDKWRFYLPQFVIECPEVRELLNCLDDEFEKQDLTLEKIGSNRNLTRILGSEIVKQELDYGMKVNSVLLEHRRASLLSKRLGTSITTKKIIEDIAKHYGKGLVDVSVDHPNYRVTIKFLSKEGNPKNLDKLKKSVSEIIPAHLLVNYEFTYATWDDYDGVVLSDLADKTFAELSVINP